MRNTSSLACDAGPRFDTEGLADSRPPHRLVTLLDRDAVPPATASGQIDEVAVWFESLLADLDGAAGAH